MAGLSRRAAGWLLALALNLLFYTLVLAPRPLPHGVAGSRWAQPVWLLPMPMPALRQPLAAMATHQSRQVAGQRKAAPASVSTSGSISVSTTAPASGAVNPGPADGLRSATPPAPALSAVPGASTGNDTLANNGNASAGNAQPGERTIRDAVRATLAEAGPAPRLPAAAGKYQLFASQVAQASVPGCLHDDALKHDPPTIPGTAIALKGLLVLPHLAHAALTGRCR